MWIAVVVLLHIIVLLGKLFHVHYFIADQIYPLIAAAVQLRKPHPAGWAPPDSKHNSGMVPWTCQRAQAFDMASKFAVPNS